MTVDFGSSRRLHPHFACTASHSPIPSLSHVDDVVMCVMEVIMMCVWIRSRSNRSKDRPGFGRRKTNNYQLRLGIRPRYFSRTDINLLLLVLEFIFISEILGLGLEDCCTNVKKNNFLLML
jgi:hypothetical protein